MNMRSLLIVTALIEAATGVALLAVPSATATLLLGDELSSPQALVVGRVAGAALISIAVTCWLGRIGDHRAAQKGLVAGVLIYDVTIPLLLMYAAFAYKMHGIGLWPASALHIVLATWCVACLRLR